MDKPKDLTEFDKRWENDREVNVMFGENIINALIRVNVLEKLLVEKGIFTAEELNNKLLELSGIIKDSTKKIIEMSSKSDSSTETI